MLKDRWIYVNDAFIPWEDATVHVASHSFARGSAIFEVLSLHETPSGPAIFRLDEHINRLFKSARFMEMALPTSPKSLLEKVKETVRKNRIQKGVIKIVCYYSQIALDILPPSGPAGILIFAVDPEADMPGFTLSDSKKASACISRWRKLDPQTVPVEAKASANYLNGMMARLEARKRGFDQAILLDTQGFIAEGGTESIFIVKDGVLLTPACGTVLRSITRKSLLELAFAKKIVSKEVRIPPQQLYVADEVFLSCTPFKVLALHQIDDRKMPAAPGPFTRKLTSFMEAIVHMQDEAFRKWLFPVK